MAKTIKPTSGWEQAAEYAAQQIAQGVDNKTLKEEIEKARKRLMDQVINGRVEPLTENPYLSDTDTVPGRKETHTEWLDRTQNMRVVALNEAKEFAIEFMKLNGRSGISAHEVVATADIFARFLVDNHAQGTPPPVSNPVHVTKAEEQQIKKHIADHMKFSI